MRAMLAKLALTLIALTAVGCSSVETRIEENRETFDSLDATVKSNLLAGRIELGYSMDMTYIAHGEPDQVIHSENEHGESVTWVYQYTYPVYGYRHRFYGFSRYPYYRHDPFFYYYDPYAYAVREYLRVTFKDGLVIALQETN